MGWFRHGCGGSGERWPHPMFLMGGRGWGFPGNIHFEFGDGPRSRHGGGSPGGRRRMFGSGELKLVLLKLIADEPRHGYDLIRAIEELTHGDYAPSPGVVYPTLTLLADMGLIEEQASEGARKKFAVTEEGRRHLADNAAEVERLFERLEETGSSRREHSRPEIGRAIGNLMQAMKNRVAREGWNDELLAEVTDILDEAARRIERLR
jgi:DNA-binding PadR family transcriptional regulator